MEAAHIRDLRDDERSWLRDTIDATWGLPVVTPGGVYEHPEALHAVVGEIHGQRAGVGTYNISTNEWEIVTVMSLSRRVGVGRAMMEAMRERATRAGAVRIWLITTDTNADALAFYDRLDMVRGRVHENFIEKVRAYKPHIPGEPFRDAIEFEWVLS